MVDIKKDNNGFTLVELIVIIVILGILSAMMMPAFLSYIDDVKTQQDIINAKELMTAGQKVMDEIYYAGLTPNWNMQYQEVKGNDRSINWIGRPDSDKNENDIDFGTSYVDMFKDAAGLWKGKTESSINEGENGAPVFSEKCPYMVCLIVGFSKDYVYSSDPRIKKKGYTVYGIIYQRRPDSKAICFDGNQWITDMKTGNTTWPFNKDGRGDRIFINNKEIKISYYWINKFVPKAGNISQIMKLLPYHGYVNDSMNNL